MFLQTGISFLQGIQGKNPIPPNCCISGDECPFRWRMKLGAREMPTGRGFGHEIMPSRCSGLSKRPWVGHMAGKGMGSLTQCWVPKELVHLGGRSLLLVVLRRFLSTSTWPEDTPQNPSFTPFCMGIFTIAVLLL